jgi:hypothetical protein
MTAVGLAVGKKNILLWSMITGTTSFSFRLHQRQWLFWLLLYAHRHRSIIGAAGHIILTPTNQLMEEYNSEPSEQSCLLKMDRENSLTSLLPEWGSNPIPSDPQSASNRLRHRLGTFIKDKKLATLFVRYMYVHVHLGRENSISTCAFRNSIGSIRDFHII